MNQLPVLKGKKNIQFTNPLAGFVYDNKKYADSCFIQNGNEDQNHINLQKQHSNSIHSVFFKTPIATKMILNKSTSDVKAQKEFRITKVLNLTKRLSQNSRFRCTRNKWIDKQPLIQESKTKRQKVLMFEQQGINLMAREVKHFRFAEIKTLVLDVFYSLADLQKIFKINPKKYFQLFFSQSLSGLLFPELIAIVQKYIKFFMSELKKQQDDCEQDSQVHKQNLGILSKYQLYKRLLQLQKNKKYDVLKTVIRSYCIPNKQLRTVYLADLLSLTSIQLYETFNCSKDKQYVLINCENGNVITDFIEITFSTNVLFISEKKKAQQNYQRYLQILNNGSKSKTKSHFRETLKHHFRQKVLRGNYDLNEQSPKPFHLDVSQKRRNLLKAQKIVDVKNERNSSPHQRIKSFTSQITEQKSTVRSREKIEIVKKPKQQLHSIYSIDRKIQEQFRILKMRNDFTNTILRNDEAAKDKIEVSVLVNENVYFKNKSRQHITRILIALGFLKQGQFQRLDSSHLITIQQFSRMRKIINCIGEKQLTINFVDRYLTYDQYGQLSKQNFRKTLNFIVGTDGKTAEIILNTIWNWLQKNGVTTSTSICRKQMQLSYEKNKLVYYLLISLIFGTNQFTALDLATQTLF